MLGPAYVVPRLLDSTGLKLSDISVFEFHEAFAGQVLANLKVSEFVRRIGYADVLFVSGIGVQIFCQQFHEAI